MAKSSIFESEVERRGKLAAEEPGEFQFKNSADLIDFVAGALRRSTLNLSMIQRGTDGDVKSVGTISKLRAGQTKFPRLQTIFGSSGSIGLEITITRRPKL